MRDPMNWAVPLFRAFGIMVRLHIFYIVITLSVVLRLYQYHPENWPEYTITVVGLLFVIVLLHEFGHCFAARREGGEADEILIWPLGGLAFCTVPHTARANFITAAGGPLVNVAICVLCTLALVPAGYVPPFNPVNSAQIWSPELYNWKDGRYQAVQGHTRWYDRETNQLVNGHVMPLDKAMPPEMRKQIPEAASVGMVIDGESAQRWVYSATGQAPVWVVWVSRVFFLSWVLLLFNLLPAFPLDGGRLLQCYIWGRTGDYRRATAVACYSGYVVALLFTFVALAWNETMLFGLGLFVFVTCRIQFMQMEMNQDDAPFGYDFSQGYTSLERDEAAPPKAKPPHRVRRWLDARKARRHAAEEQRQRADESRLDGLLDKIHREGKQSLSDEERRFMQRVSARYRNRS